MRWFLPGTVMASVWPDGDNDTDPISGAPKKAAKGKVGAGGAAAAACTHSASVVANAGVRMRAPIEANIDLPIQRPPVTSMTAPVV
jgi:hypothetical protein